MRTSLYALLLGHLLLCAGATHANEVLWQKKLSKGRMLAVSIQELPLQEEISKMRERMRSKLEKIGGTLIEPDRVVIYSLLLYSPAQKKPQPLWSKKRSVYEKQHGPRTDFRVLDAQYEDQGVVIVYKESKDVSAEVKYLRAPKNNVSSWPYSKLMRDEPGNSLRAVSALIAGSLKQGDLSVTVKDNRAVARRFVLTKAAGRTRWIRQTAPKVSTRTPGR